ncbi:restriction endonuclease subunit S [Sorangium sp. So ce542]|uniref:restriction endonuclease subunit S n=1 Tax=Sorangium sp. So ce542 TaxID=3133316 RepID=UPI003F611330
MTSTSTREEQASDAAIEAADIPAGWAYTSLGTLAELKGGITKGQKRRWDEPVRTVPYLRVANVQRGRIDLSDVSVIEATDREIAELQLRTGDVLFNEGGDRDKLGRGWVWEGQLPLCIHQNHVFRARIRNGIILPKLLSLYGNTFGQRYFLQEGKQTTNLASINLTKLSALPVPVPPLAEQRRILAKVEALTAQSRCAKEALDAIPALLERFRKSVLAAAFRGDLTADWREKNPDVEPAEELLKRIRAERRRRWEQAELAKMRAKGKVPGDDRWKERYEEPEPVGASDLPELPEGWAWASVEELATKVVDGVHKKPIYTDSGIPFLTVKNLTAGPSISFEDVNHVSLSDHKEFIKRTDPERGDILISKDGTLGVTRLIRTDIAFSIFVSLALVKPVLRNMGEYLELAFLSPYFQERFKRTGSGLQHIHLVDLRMAALPLAPIAEHNEIVRRCTRLMAGVQSLEELHLDTSRRASELDNAILAKAFRGELVPQDANDEPASVLLERLRAEAAQNSSTANGTSRLPKTAAREPSKSNSSANGRKGGTRLR